MVYGSKDQVWREMVKENSCNFLSLPIVLPRAVRFLVTIGYCMRIFVQVPESISFFPVQRLYNL